MTTTKRQPTERQLAALAKAREALVKKHTCDRCGWEDPARGLQRQSQDRIYNTRHDGVIHRTCISCRIYYHWLDTRQRIELELSTLFAERTPFFVLDLETTGKLESRSCQIVEIAVVNQDGQVCYHALCKPDIPMPASASAINGLTDAVLANAPSVTQIWPEIVQALSAADVPIYTWNADFDRQALLLTAKRFGLLVPEVISTKGRWRCAMKMHARWYGEWSNGKDDYRWQPLVWACSELEIESSDAHRAIGDAQMTLRVLQALGSRAGTSPPPAEMAYHERFYGD